MGLPGLSAEQVRLLWDSFEQRLTLPAGERRHHELPVALRRNWRCMGWWLLLTELHDRPLWTLAGILTLIIDPLMWVLRHWPR